MDSLLLNSNRSEGVDFTPFFSKGVGVGFHSKIKGVTNTLAKNQIKVHTYVGAVRVTIHFVFHEIAM